LFLNICGIDGDMSVILNQHTKKAKKETKNSSYFTFTKKKYATHINQNSIIRKTSAN
jgi:hypothetical protein